MASVDGARASDKPCDTVRKVTCGPCVNSGVVKEASAYCRQCEEHMCVDCASRHKDYKLARNHSIISGSDMLLTEQTGVKKLPLSYCAEHGDKPIEFQPSGKLAEVFSGIDQLGTLEVDRPETVCVDSPETAPGGVPPVSGRKSWSDMEVVSSTVINVDSTDVIGSAIMPDGRLILADRSNKHIILLNNRDFTMQCTLTLPGPPYDVAVYGDNAAVVTLPDKKKLQYIHVDTTLRAGHTIPTGLVCWGVAVHNGEIYVTVWSDQDGYHVQVMDTRGNVTRRIGAGVHATDPWSVYPSYITVGTGGAVYISYYRSSYITCYTQAGEVLYDVQHGGIPTPQGMLADEEDNLLVCCSGSNDIHVLGKDGAHRRVILSSADGLVNPQSVSYRRSDQTLIVTMWNTTPSCRAYKLK